MSFNVNFVVTFVQSIVFQYVLNVYFWILRFSPWTLNLFLQNVRYAKFIHFCSFWVNTVVNTIFFIRSTQDFPLSDMSRSISCHKGWKLEWKTQKQSWSCRDQMWKSFRCYHELLSAMNFIKPNSLRKRNIEICECSSKYIHVVSWR